ncbi:MAG: PH domain-containing protein [Patescibacteria group bacterium]
MSPENKDKFPGQRPNEHLIMLLRRHWIAFASAVIQVVSFNLLPVIALIIVLYVVGWNPPTRGLWYVFGVIATSLYYIGTWLTFYHAYIDYHLDVWILTDQRIINIEQKGLFERTISELNLTKVQDVTAEIHGKLATVFNYGDVFIQSAGEQQRFTFLQIPEPDVVARLVIEASDALK